MDGLAADVTAAAVAELVVEPGAELWFAVKATEVAIHGVGVKGPSPGPIVCLVAAGRGGYRRSPCSAPYVGSPRRWS